MPSWCLSVQCFFKDPKVVSSLSTKVDTGAPAPLGMSCPPQSFFRTNNRKLDNTSNQASPGCVWPVCVDRPVRVEVEQVPCTRVSMDLFDPIYSCGVLRPSGHMVKCFHDVYPDYDELRQVLVCPYLPVSLGLFLDMVHFSSVPPDAAGWRVRALLRGWEGNKRRVFVHSLQASVFRRRALSVRRHHWSLHEHHKADLQGSDQVRQETRLLIEISWEVNPPECFKCNCPL